MKMFKIRAVAVIVCLAALTFSALADAKSEAHDRRKARKNEVAALIASADASEGESGYLVPKEGLPDEKKAVVEAENRDRKIGYTAIAKQHKTSVEIIAKAAGKINRKKSDRKK